MSMMNRLANVSNKFQGDQKRVLCVCSAGLLRSPTAAWVLGNEPFGYNTRAAGVSEEYALIVVDDALIAWADEIVCMEDEHKQDLEVRFDLAGKVVRVLDIPDMYPRMHPQLVRMIEERYQRELNG